MRLNVDKFQVGGGLVRPQVDTTGFYSRAVDLTNKYKNLN
jgi:hypothetical protein